MRRRSGRRHLVTVVVTGCVVVVCSQLGAPAAPAATAATVSVSGVVYWDQDDNGVRDPGEPGVAGIRVHYNGGSGTPSVTTDGSGAYALTGVPSGGVGSIVVETGWFRSQCTKLSCPPGPGDDNDFPTKNQFIQLPMSSVTGSLSDLDVGLLPDWPGSSAAPPSPVQGAVPANAVDVAARLSWVTSTCTDGTHFICRPGDTYTVNAQFLNQGTTPLTGLQAVLALPAGDGLATGKPAADVQLNTPATSPGVTGLTVTAPGSDGVLRLAFAGTLVPGGLVKVTARLVAGGTVGTPGCVRGAPTAACPTAEPYAAPLVLAVSRIDQSGDPDSFGPGCDADQDVRLCPTGIHDKQVEPDEVDPVGHDVDASVGTSSTFDLSATVSPLSVAPVGGWKAGQPVTWRVSAFDTGPVTGFPGWSLTLLLPKSSKPVLPVANAMRSCVKGTTATGFPFVRCSGKGPLGPAVTSVAMDVTMTIPTATKPGAPVPVLAYVQPAPTDGAETVPLGTAPTGPTVDASTTATDNDASAAVTVS